MMDTLTNVVADTSTEPEPSLLLSELLSSSDRASPLIKRKRWKQAFIELTYLSRQWQPSDGPPPLYSIWMASSEVDQKFLGYFAKVTTTENNYLSRYVGKGPFLQEDLPRLTKGSLRSHSIVFYFGFWAYRSYLQKSSCAHAEQDGWIQCAIQEPDISSIIYYGWHARGWSWWSSTSCPWWATTWSSVSYRINSKRHFITFSSSSITTLPSTIASTARDPTPSHSSQILYRRDFPKPPHETLPSGLQRAVGANAHRPSASEALSEVVAAV